MDLVNLHQTAVAAMRTRGLLPVFAPQTLQAAEAVRQASPGCHGGMPDLRHLSGFSIDNDDTRDLDQRSVAEPLGSGEYAAAPAMAARSSARCAKPQARICCMDALARCSTRW